MCVCVCMSERERERVLEIEIWIIIVKTQLLSNSFKGSFAISCLQSWPQETLLASPDSNRATAYETAVIIARCVTQTPTHYSQKAKCHHFCCKVQKKSHFRGLFLSDKLSFLCIWDFHNIFRIFCMDLIDLFVC